MNMDDDIKLGKEMFISNIIRAKTLRRRLESCRKIFEKSYYEEHGTLDGFTKEWEWRTDPYFWCVQEILGRRCRTRCTSCQSYKRR